MLLTSITCLDDQVVAEKMRNIAERVSGSRILAEQAADEAVAVFRQTDSAADAINAGVAFLKRASGVSLPNTESATPREPQAIDFMAWGERHPIERIGLGVVAFALLILTAWGLS